jgi:hypothetical protein
MNNNIERFIRDNREGFDNLEPSARVWESIEAEIGQVKQKRPVLRMEWFKWSIAAALLLAITVTAVYLFNQDRTNPVQKVVKQTEPQVDKTDDADLLVQDIDPQYAKMVSQFTAMIEDKQTEIRALEKVNPDLYHQFSDDIQKLDSTYQVLRSTLTANPNKEQLLQAMIQNLQMQIELLNQQLTIIQRLKQPKSKQI